MKLPDAFGRLLDMWSRFPGIGEKTARRMVFFMLEQSDEWTKEFARAIGDLHDNIRMCRECGSITTDEICAVCSDETRDRHTICVVETQEDRIAIEQSGIYDGLYHVLGGRCSPLEDQTVPHESLRSLRRRVEELDVRETILALSPRVEGDMTAYTIQEALSDVPTKITRLAYGLPAGGSIGYADRMTLHMALDSRREMVDW